ncbi:MAG: flavodoxin-dependent (E)-4-hydroxy-3-methylbut-2-enyl-diphosphate synthase [Oscillospiraceae bacterium]|jgi:(E)-4-hydroxy-3-methylbut-2-enyl-diphosphate synthase|nr:flavodoxin-dependent (E)-4-hydroxy-3-methylbut-2-enyl-diphosphate synthase [Oscillospiraceae bacterium]
MTRQINVGGVLVGGGAPVTVQSMCDTDTRDVAATLSQIRGLHAAGCEIVRVAVPDTVAADALREIVGGSPVPVVADIHFDYKLAVRAVENGVAKVRVNPGNIGSREKVREIVKACAERKVPIRVGVNGGSVKRELIERHGLWEAMLLSGLEQTEILEDMGFTDICLSFKASNVSDTVAVNRMAAERCGIPLHLGVTEAGTSYNGIIKSSAGIGALLLDGIGDTIRVSLAAPPAEEVRAAIALLKAVGLRKGGVEVVACPTCARRGFDVAAIAREAEARLSDIQAPLKVAVMGCVVNGPGEARDADIGVAGGGGQAVLFCKGEAVRKVAEAEILDVLVAEARKLVGNGL